MAVAVSIVCNVEAKLTCALFTDKNAVRIMMSMVYANMQQLDLNYIVQGYQFGRLLARELLYTFIQARIRRFSFT
jgi:hypothetical protein